MKDTRELLLDSAFASFYKHGYQGANIAAILKEVGINKGSMYHFFKSKKELALAVIKERIERNLKAKYEAVLQEEKTLQQLFNTLRDATETLSYGCPLNKMSQEMLYIDDDFKVLLSEVYVHFESDIEKIPYKTHPYTEKNGITFLITENGKEIPLKIFGKHNMQNISAAKMVANKLGIDNTTFYDAIARFEGSAKRLEKVFDKNGLIVFNDFAHAPSKVASTVKAVREKYPSKKLIAVFELHNYSSLNKKFLPKYENTLDDADHAIVYYNKHTLELKRLPEITPDDVKKAFGRNDLVVMTDRNELIKHLKLNYEFNNTVLLMMSSGNFSGIDIAKLGKVLIKPLRKK
jgi:UDP-N-acetylmuramate: L-alanyl-gamma-D-glutamyl-meso-diaminopimelate ligase